MFISYVISYSFMMLACVLLTRDYLLPVIFILFDVGVRSLLPIVTANMYFEDATFDVNLNLSLHIQLLTIPLSFYIFNKFGRRLRLPRYISQNQIPTIPNILIYLLIFLVAFYFLLIFALGNWALTDWLANPRQGYLLGRKGVGVFYVLFVLHLNLAWVALVGFPNRLPKIVTAILCCYILYFAYLSGSKRVVVSLFLFYMVLRHIYVKPLKLWSVVLGGLLLMSIFIIYFLLGTGQISDLVGYFQYFFTTREIYEMLDSGRLQHQYGAINSTRIWEFIPRFIYPDKPFVYGGGYVTELIAPGQAEKGHNLGMLDFTAYYIDFGQLGVLYHSLSTGASAGIIYGIFMKNRNSFIFCLLYLSLFSNILPSSPAPLFFTLLIIFYIMKLLYKQIFWPILTREVSRT